MALVNPTEMATTSAGSPAKDQKERELILLPSKPPSTLRLLPAQGMGQGRGEWVLGVLNTVALSRRERGQEVDEGGAHGRRHGSQSANEMQDA